VVKLSSLDLDLFADLLRHLLVTSKQVSCAFFNYGMEASRSI
jgi:hypothetical protein